MKNKRKSGKQSKPIKKTRKEIRKDKRNQKKVNRALHNEKKKKVPGKFVLNPDRGEEKKKLKENPKNEIVKPSNPQEKKLKKISVEMEKTRKKQLKRANVEEDKTIKKLEKKLKLNKRKNKSIPKSFAADGLDYLLDFCDEENRKLAVETEKQLLKANDDSDFEEDFAKASSKQDQFSESDENRDSGESDDDSKNHKASMEPKKKKKKIVEEIPSEKMEIANDSEDESDDASSDESSGQADELFTGPETNVESSEEEHFLYTDSEDNDDNFGDSENEDNNFDDSERDDDNSEDIGESDGTNEEENSPENDEAKNEKCIKNEDGTWEDIYGRKRDKDGKVLTGNSGKYVPPAARLKQLENDSNLSEKLSRLRKQLKGHINRLAEHNMHTIVGQIEDLYMSNSRNDMNEMLAKLMMESIVSRVMTPDRLVAEHMMLVAILHANVGTEVGAHFLLSTVRRLDDMMKTSEDIENKEIDNVVLMLSHLYNFKVYGSGLLYQILGNLSDKFTEKEIELILLILKTVGFLLRKDDPSALKELILRLQQKASGSKSENSRVKFMLDVLLAIKNNNMTKIPQYDPSHIEHLKKIMKTFLRKGNAVTQFNISLEDLLQVNERGKWWVVGSAWTGNNDLTKPQKSTDATGKPLFSQKILDLARKQRMNTDTRRNIFCILMTAEDYLDAFEKLHHLGLKDQQAREIIHVIMDCCLQEKKFNPYYAVLAQKFCDYDRKNQMSMQYSLWDKLKSLDEYNDKQLTNLAKFLTHLFIEKGLPLSVLKVVEFGELDKPTMRLLRQIVLGILLHEDSEACAHVFERISISPQLKAFREGLRLFINHFLMKNAESRAICGKEIEKLKARGELADKILLTRAGRTVF